MAHQFIYSFFSFSLRAEKLKYEFPNFNMITTKNNGFAKEYVIGRKDQFDIDYAIFRKAVEETETREELIQMLEEKLNYVISHVANQIAKDLMEEMNLI